MENIEVAVRVRPLTQKEEQEGQEFEIWQCNADTISFDPERHKELLL
jgi:hypothetical protein